MTIPPRHNYPDSKALQILANIRNAEPFKLLLIDRLVLPHLRTEAPTVAGEAEIYQQLRTAGGTSDDRTGSAGVVPASSQGLPTMYDLFMGSLHGGKTRTLDEWKALLSHAQFRITKVYPLRASTGQALLEAHCSGLVE